MLSFKEYKEIQEKLLNENLGGDIPLGVRQPNTIANLQSKWDEMGMKMSMPMMMKKKSKKWMEPGLGGDDEDLEVNTDVDADVPEDDMDVDDEEELDMDDDDEEEDIEVDDEEELEEPNPMVNKLKNLAQGAKMMHKGAKKMGKWKEGKEEKCPCGKDCDCGPECDCYKKHEGKKNMCHCGKMMSKEGKCSKCGKKKMSMGGMNMSKKEHQAFLNDLKAMTGHTYFSINPDGTWNEDAVLAPEDPNSEIADEPQPGEPGFAPQGKVGSSWESGFDTFAEWVKKGNRKK